MKKIIGYSIIVSPFIGLFIFASINIGILNALLIFGGIAMFVAFIGVGAKLIVDNEL